jgi:hypothetical protein
MPITTHPDHAKLYGDDQDHWDHVMTTLLVKAIEQAGFQPITPAADGANLIHGLIIQNLSEADLVLVDLSTHNPNVFFELGVRTSIDRPIALIRDEHTSLPFDISGINAYQYDSSLLAWELDRQQEDLAKHIKASYASCDGRNPLWRKFGLTIKASEPDANETPLEAKVDLISGQIAQMQGRLEKSIHRSNSSERFTSGLRNYLAHHDVKGLVTYSAVGPDHVQINFHDEIDSALVARAEELAEIHETQIRFVLPGGQEDGSAIRGRARRKGSEVGDLNEEERRLRIQRAKGVNPQ